MILMTLFIEGTIDTFFIELTLFNANYVYLVLFIIAQMVNILYLVLQLSMHWNIT